MNGILLAAGYGTRMYPLTRNRPKALLPLAGRPILDYLLDDLQEVPELDRLLLVVNARFAEQFQRWADARQQVLPLRILNDGSTCDDNRLGAVADIRFALHERDALEQSAYILATDNLPRFDLGDLVEFSDGGGHCAVFAIPERNRERLRRTGVAEIDADGRVVAFQEKPDNPRGSHRIPPFYVYTPEALQMVEEYLGQGGDPDAPGNLLGWLVERVEVRALERPAGTYDLGTIEEYDRTRREFQHKGPPAGSA